jgi:lipopolysaccharide/colanic/teichoic acid biosynthesis glycosyltransferase
LPIEALLRLKASGIVVQDVAVAYESVTGQVPVSSHRPTWLLLSDGFRVSKATLLYKRVASIVGSVLFLLVCAPLMALVAVAVRLDSPGPVIFRQQRVGKDGKRFTIYKFRSMREGSECDSTPAEENDGRFTRVGRYIRPMRLDELPQLYNILRGDMCFVGPRPFVPEAEEFFAETIPMYRGRWAVRPGATGWAQIQKGYCATLEDNIEKLGFDLFYIENLSIGLDFLILFQTIKVLLLGRGAR